MPSFPRFEYAGAVVGFVVAAAVAWLISPALAPVVVTVVAASAVLLAVLAGTNTVRREIESRYRRLEAIQAMYALVRPRRALPAFTEYVASPEFARAVVETMLSRRPGRVLELGSGLSTLLVGYCLEAIAEDDGIEPGHVVSLDHQAEFARQTRARVEEHGLGAVTTVLHAPLESIDVDGHTHRWYATAGARAALTGSVDLLIVDGPPGKDQPMARYPALPQLHELLSPDAVILVDDARRPDEQRMVAEWTERFDDFTHEYRDTEKGTSFLYRNAPAE